MNLIIFCFYMPLVHSELHTFITTYTERNGRTTAGIPEISAITTLDGEQIDYYYSDIKKLIPRQDWMKEFASTETWKKYKKIREQIEQTNKINISFLMKQFKQSHGVHTYQRLYGCDWDDETGHSNYFDQHSYDGENFISLDVVNSRYNTAVPQGRDTMDRWNNDRAQLINLRRYYRDDCVGWVMDLERRGPKKTHLKILAGVMYVFIAIFMVLVVLVIGTKFLVWRKTKGFRPVSQNDDGIYMYINKGL